MVAPGGAAKPRDGMQKSSRPVSSSATATATTTAAGGGAASERARREGVGGRKQQAPRMITHMLLGATVVVALIAFMITYNTWLFGSSSEAASSAQQSHTAAWGKEHTQRREKEEEDARLAPDAYAQYEATARAKKWSHSDPLEKLKSSIRIFEAQFDVAEPKKSTDIITMILQEFDYIFFRVLLPSTRRAFDVTDVVLDLLEGAQRTQFRALKAHLLASSSYPPSPSPSEASAISANTRNSSRPAVVSRSQLDTDPLIAKYLFAPLEIITKASIAKDSNIKIRWCDRGGRMQLTPLSLAVRYRQHSLIPVLFNVTGYCDMKQSLMEAVHNGDAIAAEVLITSILRSPRAQEYVNMGFVSVLEEAHIEAKELGFLNTQVYIRSLIDYINLGSTGVTRPRENDGAPVRSCAKDDEFAINYFAKLMNGSGTAKIAVPCPPNDSSSGNEVSRGDVRQRCRIPTYQFIGAKDSCNMGIPCIKASQFADQFVSKNQPVAVRGIVNLPEWKRQWIPSELASHSGDFVVQVGRVPYEELFVADKMPLNRTSSIRDYVSELFEHSEFSNTVGEFIRRLHGSSGAGENGSEVSFWMDQTGAVYIRNGERDESLSTIPFPRYVFDNKILNPRFRSSASSNAGSTLNSLSKFFGLSNSRDASSNTRLFETMIRKVIASKGTSLASADEPITAQLYIGPPFSGAPFHFHGPAFNALIFGRKLWFISPPGREAYSNAHPLEWGNLSGAGGALELNRLDACSFIQEEGDVVFVPRHWSHQVLNLEASIGFAIEVHDYK